MTTHPYGPGTFYRVAVGKGRSIFVEIKRDNGGDRLSGFRVTKEGCKFETETKEEVQHHLIIFKRTNTTGRYRLNLHYGELEEIPNEQP